MFCDTIRRLRVEFGVSQKDVAEYLNISRQAYNHYESGKREPSYEILKMLAEYFNVSTDYLVGKTTMRTPSEDQDYTIPNQFTDPSEARKYVMMHDIFGSNGMNVSKMDDEEIIKFANDLMKQMEMVSYKYRK